MHRRKPHAVARQINFSEMPIFYDMYEKVGQTRTAANQMSPFQ